MQNNLRSVFFLLLIAVISYFAVKPIFTSGFFPMHDDTQPSRVFEMAQALRFGQFPVRLVGDLGYGFGYPLFNFYAPLPYYIGGIFNLAGFDAIISTKYMFLIGIFFAGAIMFFLAKEIAGDIAGLTAAILYMYAPYHAVNIYVRGAVGEYYAYGFLPLLMLGIYQLIKDKNKKKGIILGSTGFAGIILSHNILGMITTYFLIAGTFLYLIYLFSKKKNLLVICYLLAVFCLGGGLSAFFIIPAIAEKNYTKVDQLTKGGSDFHTHFVYADQLWNSPWGYGGSAKGREDGMSFKIGKIHLLLGLLGVTIAFYLYKTKRINNYSRLSGILDAVIPIKSGTASGQFTIYNILFIIFLVSVFLMLESSRFIWEAVPGFSFIQYPWRFLNFTILSLSLLASSIFLILPKTKQIILAVVVIGLVLWLNAKYFVPREILPLKEEDYTSRENLRWKISSISFEYMPKEFVLPNSFQEVAWEGLSQKSGVVIKRKSEEPAIKEYQLEVKSPTSILTNIAFFPGWKAKLDGQELDIYDTNGRIGVNLPAGYHKLEFVLRNTIVRYLSNTVSLFSLFLLIYITFFWERSSYGKKI